MVKWMTMAKDISEKVEDLENRLLKLEDCL